MRVREKREEGVVWFDVNRKKGKGGVVSGDRGRSRACYFFNVLLLSFAREITRFWLSLRARNPRNRVTNRWVRHFGDCLPDNNTSFKKSWQTWLSKQDEEATQVITEKLY
uniref:Uncharacterized protein n=1 Tax=Knipowitschia caucasica TaxID=637954 RepID=A0AAV2LPK6_KNICA